MTNLLPDMPDDDSNHKADEMQKSDVNLSFLYLFVESSLCWKEIALFTV